MAAADAAVQLTAPDAAARREAELEARLSGLQAGSALDARLHDLLASKLNAGREAAALEAQRLHRGAAQVRRRRPAQLPTGSCRLRSFPACPTSWSITPAALQQPTDRPTPRPPPTQRERALGHAAAQAELDAAKARVDLHRWRQRTALLKVRLSSAHEDVDRYRRMGELLRRQYELEVAAKRGSQAQAVELGGRVAALAARMAEQAAALAALQADLLAAQEAVEARDREIAAQQEALVMSSDQAQAALAEARAGAARLQEQLQAVQERARLADQTAATAQVGAVHLCIAERASGACLH